MNHREWTLIEQALNVYKQRLILLGRCQVRPQEDGTFLIDLSDHITRLATVSYDPKTSMWRFLTEEDE
jgi:hypothetical protein